MKTEIPLPPREKMSNYRRRLRAQGLRSMQVWVPDTRLPQFKQEARRQSLLVAKDAGNNALTEWLEAAADTEGWDE
jgi:hypothetical protein